MEDLLAVRVCVEFLDCLLRVDSALEGDFDIDLFGGVVVDGGDLQLAGLARLLDGLDEGVRRGPRRDFSDDHLLIAVGLYLRPHAYIPESVRVP